MQRKIVAWIMMSLVLIALMVLVSCAPAAPATPTATKVTRVSIAGGSIGGTTNLIANTFAGVIQKYLGMDATVLTYPMANTAIAAGTKETDLGMTNTEQSYEPYEGVGSWKDKPPLNGLREFMPTYAGVMQIWVPVDSPVKTFRDLVGKRISPGTKGMGPASILDKGCPALGLDLEKSFDVAYLGHVEAGSALIAGKIEAYMATSAPPHPTFVEVDLKRPLRLIGFTEQDAKALTAAVSGIVTAVIPPKYYHMKEPVLTVASVGFGTAHMDFSEDIIYGIVKNTIQNPDFVGFYYETFKKWIQDNESGAKYWVENNQNKMPFHKGAIRFYQEIGWKLPAGRIPPEAKK